jgi:hypothetical protein
VLFAATATILAFGVLVAALTWNTVSASDRVGADLRLYLDATRGVLAGQPLYPAHQLAGPYALADGDILYPPPILVLMAPFLLVPSIVFWVAPLATIALVVIRHRPSAWSWPFIALGLAYPVTSLKIVHGNPVMWIVAAIALGTITAGPAALVLLKPTLAPFALIGAHRRRWWVVLGAAALIAVAFVAIWPDYLRVLANARNPNGILYSLDEVPFALVPVVAWLASPGFMRPSWVSAVRRLRTSRVATPL